MGFQRVVNNLPDEIPIPTPTAEGFALVLEAIHTEGDADSFLGVLAGILEKLGFIAEAHKVIGYPSIFCPCVTHETRIGGAKWASSLSQKPNSWVYQKSSW